MEVSMEDPMDPIEPENSIEHELWRTEENLKKNKLHIRRLQKENEVLAAQIFSLRSAMFQFYKLQLSRVYDDDYGDCEPTQKMSRDKK